MKVHFNRISGNGKTGPIPVTMSPKSSCPDNCNLKGSGCYAESGNVNIHWSNLSNGKMDNSVKVFEWPEFTDQIKALPKRQLWRHNVAGDLPANDDSINADMLALLVEANKGRMGFTYTHHKVIGHIANQQIIKLANDSGFTINLSADNAEHADKLAELNIGPVVCLLPEDTEKVTFTPNGRTIVQCPATYQDNVTCSNCAICAKQRKAIIGFPVHGVSKRKAKTIMMKAL